MKNLVVGLLAVAMLAGCALRNDSSTPILSEDGSKSYIQKGKSMNTDSDKKATSDLMHIRAKKLCPFGYKIINEENELATHPIFRVQMGLVSEATRQIQCNKAPS